MVIPPSFFGWPVEANREWKSQKDSLNAMTLMFRVKILYAKC